MCEYFTSLFEHVFKRAPFPKMFQPGLSGALGHVEIVAAPRPCYVIVTEGSYVILSVPAPPPPMSTEFG